MLHSGMRHCCEPMRAATEGRCDVHPDRFQCPDALIAFDEKRHSFGLIVHDGGTSTVTIRFCPWCGADLRQPAGRAPVAGRGAG